MAYLPLSTASLPDPVIDPAQGASPEDYFGTLLFTGDGTSGRTIATGETGVVGDVNFTPDLAWIKSRSDATNHLLTDVIRGGTAQLRSNLTDAESQFGNVDLTFVDGGFTNAGSSSNESGRTFVTWNWKANGSGVTNNVGSITSTVSANTTSGFSIVSYTGTNVAGTIGHGLGAEAQMVIVKARDYVDGWYVQHTGMTSASHYQTLNNANADALAATVWNGTYPTSTVFNVGTSNAANKSGTNYIAYVFANVEGFSKFGSYVGNGSADGPFVFCGFRPAFVMVKATSITSNWELHDSERGPYNPVGPVLLPNTSDADITTSRFDFCSNGFKLRGTGSSVNGSGVNIIYMAFAENPFKYSNAR